MRVESLERSTGRGAYHAVALHDGERWRPVSWWPTARAAGRMDGHDRYVIDVPEHTPVAQLDRTNGGYEHVTVRMGDAVIAEYVSFMEADDWRPTPEQARADTDKGA